MLLMSKGPVFMKYTVSGVAIVCIIQKPARGMLSSGIMMTTTAGTGDNKVDIED